MARSSLKEVSVVDKIEVLLSGVIQVRTRDQILKNDQEVAATFSRHVLAPGDNLEGQDPRVAAIANAIWTEEVVAEYKKSIEPTEPTVTE